MSESGIPLNLGGAEEVESLKKELSKIRENLLEKEREISDLQREKGEMLNQLDAITSTVGQNHKLNNGLPSRFVVFFSQREEHDIENTVAYTVYFERKPTEEEMKKLIKMDMGGDDSNNYTWWESPNPVSEKAGLIRIQIG